jgi:TonB family protein
MRLNTILPLAAFLSVFVCASAQQSGLQPGPKPNALDPGTMAPATLLAFAQAHNGAGEVPGDGWHIKATFESLISPATLAYNKGSYEETWYGPQNYKRTFTYKGVTHTDIATPNGLFRSGDQGWDTPEEAAVRNLLVSPVPTQAPGADITLLVGPITSGKGATFPCLFEVYKMPPGMAQREQKELMDKSPRLCFDPALPILRFSAGIGSGAEVTFGGVTNLKGHGGQIVPKEVTEMFGGTATLKIHVEAADVPPDPTGPMVPPADAKKLASPVTVAWETMELNRFPDPSRPVYPAGAIQEHLEGDVNIAVVIAPDGTVTSAKVVDGIQMLRDSALDFVKQSKFKPFMLSGTPVEVHTIAHINFNSGGGVSMGDSGSGHHH